MAKFDTKEDFNKRDTYDTFKTNNYNHMKRAWQI